MFKKTLLLKKILLCAVVTLIFAPAAEADVYISPHHHVHHKYYRHRSYYPYRSQATYGMSAEDYPFASLEPYRAPIVVPVPVIIYDIPEQPPYYNVPPYAMPCGCF